MASASLRARRSSCSFASKTSRNSARMACFVCSIRATRFWPDARQKLATVGLITALSLVSMAFMLSFCLSSCLFSQIHAQKKSSTSGGHWFGSLYSQQFVCPAYSVAEDFQFVMDPRLGKQPLIIGEKRPCFGGRVGSVDHSGSVSIANGRFKILALLIEDFLDSLLQTILLCTDFRAQRKQRTTEHASALAPDLCLNTVTVIAISTETLDRRNRRGKK